MAVERPPIDTSYRRVVNCWPPANALPWQAVVIHIMAGTLEGCDSWFNGAQGNGNTTTRVSYGIGLNGPRPEIHEYVDPDSGWRGYAHGIVNPPNSEDFLRLWNRNGRRNPNFWAVGIEHEGHNLSTTFEQAPAVFELSTSLTAWLCDRYQIPADEDHILGHYEIDGRDRPNCPGLTPAWWAKYIATVQLKLSGEGADMALEQEVAALRNHVRYSDELDEDLAKVRRGILAPQGTAPTTGEKQEAAAALDAVVAKYNIGANPAAGVPKLDLVVLP